MCTGSNNVGATINIDPTKPASTYEAILGCESFNGLNDGPTAPSSITVGYQLGTITNGNTVTVVEAELLATTWGPAGTANSVESSAPEPSPFWLSVIGMSAICGIVIRTRRRAVP